MIKELWWKVTDKILSKFSMFVWHLPYSDFTQKILAWCYIHAHDVGEDNK